MNSKKTILILGAGSDIAKAIAREFASHGFTMQLAGRNSEKMERLQKDLISRYNTRATTHYFDAADFDSHAEFVSALTIIPDVVVYSAGAMSDQSEAARDWTKTKNMVDVNYAGAVSIINQFATLFGERNSGCIVGVSSVAGDRGRGSNYIYGSTKAAFTAFLSGLRNELFKKNVQVLTVKPGFVYTKMTQQYNLPKPLTAHPEKVAEKIYHAVQKGKSVIYVKSMWRWIMLVIRVLPEAIFKRINL